MQDGVHPDPRPGAERTSGESPARGRRSLILDLSALLASAVLALALAEAAVRLLALWPVQRAAAREVASPAAGPPPPPVTESPADQPFSRWIVHPYRGMTPRPRFKMEEGALPNVFGIMSHVEDPRHLAEDELVVGIFGGSVARSTGLVGAPAVTAALSGSLPPGAPPVRVVNFAVSGYKQPQQLFLLMELVFLGTPLDVVVNVDGYNEAVLGATDALVGHHPLYPRHDFWLSALGAAAGTLSEAQIELTARVIGERRRMSALRERLRRAPVLRRSELAHAVVGTFVQRAELEAVTAEEALRKLPAAIADRDLFQLEDPCLRQRDACWDLIVRVWTQSSELMKAVAEKAGAEYLHVLQPNQYVAGSKKLSAEELATAWKPDLDWSRAAARGYPLLREAGRALEGKGFPFHDLTQIFADHPETIYRDPCCHYHTHGYEILGAEIGRLVGDALAERGRGKPDLPGS